MAHTDGHNFSSDLEFVVNTKVEAFDDIFTLMQSDLSYPPRGIPGRPNLTFLFLSLKAQFKAFSLSLAHTKDSYAVHWQNVEFIDHILVPSLAASVESIKAMVIFARQQVLPSYTPFVLKQKFVMAPFSSLWTTDESLIKE